MKNKKQASDALSHMLSLDDEQESAVATLEVNELEAFPDHKFKLYEGDRLADMVKSIQELGVLLPVIVWKKEDKYIILSGHNRVEASKLAGLLEVPVIIKEDIDLEEATLIVTETNLHQRSFSDLSHSERAYSLAQHYEAMKQQGRRTDVLKEIESLLNPLADKESATSPQFGAKLRSDEKVGENYGLSKNSVARYIKMSTLEKSLLDLLDSDNLKLSPAYSLSFITDSKIQNEIANKIESGMKIDMKKAESLRASYEHEKLTKEVVQDILTGKQVAKKEKQKPVTISKKIMTTYFQNNETKEEIEVILMEALKSYFKTETEGCI